jgi:hypothetical protein
MTEFTETLRHHCRNPRCRSKLPMPVSNPREAFCTKGCHSSFYLHRCLACEGPLQRKREDQKVCRKAKCRNAWRAGSGFGRYATSNAKLASKTPDFVDPKTLPRPVNVTGGYNFPSAPVIDLAPITRSFPPPANDTAVSHEARWTFQSFCVARPSIHRCALPRDRMAYLSKLIGADRDAVIRW